MEDNRDKTSELLLFTGSGPKYSDLQIIRVLVSQTYIES